MKTKYIAIFASLAATGLGMAQTAYTTPVGYVSLGDKTTGQPAVKANTDVAISIPLARPTEFAGVVLSTTANTITVSGTPWTASPAVGSWNPGISSPYVVTIISGAANGFIGLVNSNTTTSLTVAAATGGSLLSIVPGDKFVISKAWTLSALIPPTAIPTGTRFLIYNGITSGSNLAPNTTVQSNGTAWRIGGTNSDNLPLYPGESFVLRSPAALAINTLVVSGEVSRAISRTFIDKITSGVAQDTRMSYVGSGDEFIGTSGLNASLGLTSGDRVLFTNNNLAGINKAPSFIQWNGTQWRQGATDVTNTFKFEAGVGYVFRRAAVTVPATGSIDWVDSPSYFPLP